MRTNLVSLIAAAGLSIAVPAFADDTTPAPAPAAEAEAAAEAPAPVDASVAVPAAPAPVAGDDIDLAALGLDTNQAQQDEALKIYGFADMSFNVPLMDKDSLLSASGNFRDASFVMGSFNLYLAKNITSRWRTLGEVRLLYSPNGNVNGDGSYTTTSATDYANFQRPVTWGGISIERAYVEYDATPWITVRAGRYLTPYGVWNVDHGSPVIIGVFKPYMIGEQVMPEHQTGIDVFGKKYFGDYGVSYHVTLSNGRGPLDAINDLDGNKALGGRLQLSTKWGGELSFGVSGYVGTYTDRRQDSFTPTGDGMATVTENMVAQYDERTVGADVVYDRGGFHFQSEFLYRELAYTDAGRAKQASGFMPDTNQFGIYGLVGYRFDWLGVMPFACFEHYEFPESMTTTMVPKYNGMTVGVNVRPTPATVVKVAAGFAEFPDASALIGDSKYAGLYTQAAWAF